MSEPTISNATFGEWHLELCRVAREARASASTPHEWMRRAYREGMMPGEAWEAFERDELPR